MKTNVLYYGDNLDILRHHIPDDSIDLTVLDVFKGKRPEMPWGGSPFAKAPTEKEKAEQEAML